MQVSIESRGMGVRHTIARWVADGRRSCRDALRSSGCLARACDAVAKRKPGEVGRGPSGRRPGEGGEGAGFLARQPRARMTEKESEQDQNCHYDWQRLK